jgi:uncharacterized protein YndB with AHSA1/START domain
MIKKVLLTLGALVAALVGLILMQPASYQVDRSTTVNAAPAEVFALINDFRQWDKWSPWAKIDPKMKATYSGAEKGVGAIYQWTGNDDVGEGRMTINESVPSERVVIKLEFIKPFESNSITTFLLKPEGSSSTSVSWQMAGDNNFMSKAMSLFASMDSMIGSDFEKGLRQMKAAAESPSK